MKLEQIYQVMAIAITCSISAGCATTYDAPTDYQYFQEYGWLPVLRDSCNDCNLHESQILISYVSHDWYPIPHGEIDTRTHPRARLPVTEAEAKSVVDNNLSLARNGSRNANANEAVKSIVAAPVIIPATMIMWAPPMAIIVGYREGHRNDPDVWVTPRVSNDEKLEPNRESPSKTSGVEAVAPTEGRLEIRVVDSAGQPVADAEVVPIFSPLCFAADADDGLHRSYGYKQFGYEFNVSSELASVLANYLGIDEAPRGTKTGVNGVQLIPLPEGQLTGVRLVHVLVHKPGFLAGSISIPVADLATRQSFTVTLKEESGSPVTTVEKLNPWIVSRDLERQVNCYLEKYNRDPDERASYSSAEYFGPHGYANWQECNASPPLDTERFEQYALAAHKLAPDYPIAQSAMFFYELEHGNIQEARKYGRFLSNEIYVKAIYHMQWTEGLLTH
jgi:hypothetical protein